MTDTLREKTERIWAGKRGGEVKDRVDFIKGKLDEIVSARGAHLEYLGDKNWYLSFQHADGTETALWFTSKDLRVPMWETRGRPESEGR